MLDDSVLATALKGADDRPQGRLVKSVEESLQTPIVGTPDPPQHELLAMTADEVLRSFQSKQDPDDYFNGVPEDDGYDPRVCHIDICPEPDSSLKPTNPKDAIGSDKLPLHLWPGTATVMGALGLLDGALKYGRANWRDAGVRASIYYDALARHSFAMFEGEDIDPDSGLPHECHALACLAIIVDAKAAGKFIDDRQYPGGYRQLIDDMTHHVKRLKDMHTARNHNPHHFTIVDVKEK